VVARTTGSVAGVTDRDLAAERAEIERLRDLVGPDERGFRDLRADLDAAREAARDAEAQAGRLRGTIAEMQVQLVRARQDQERFQRLLDARRSVHERLAVVKRRLAGSSRPE
jgi:predicted  nucleic acid-binding Zn-ribbon protein